MINNKMFFCVFLFLGWMNLHSAENDEFDFYTENIDANQLKTIEVQIPDLRSKGIEPGINTYTIKIGNDGIIRSVVRTSTIPFYRANNYFDYIYKRGNLLNIKSSEEKSRINNIKWDNSNVYVRGISSIYNSPNAEFTRINVNPENNIIYESNIIKLLRTSNTMLREINPHGGIALTYANNVTKCSFPDFLESKIVYKFMPEEIMAVYYGGMEGADIYPHPIIIKMGSDTKLYSENQAVNVINYFIAYNTVGLGDILFPLLFLEKPFTSNNWGYKASSSLKEGNTEYSPNNLSSPNGLPWASANGYGIGDKITIEMGSSPNDALIIINGFVSKDKPDLFEANSRVKQIKLTNLNNGKSKIRTIEDSASPQSIELSDLSPSRNMRLEIEILSVYPGAKYRDLCIQSIF